MELKILFLPGLDGTGLLFEDLLAQLPTTVDVEVISMDELSGSSYVEQAKEIATNVRGAKILLVAESYSGRVAYELCELLGSNIKGIVFIASFIETPSTISKLARFIPVMLLKPHSASIWLLGKVGFSGFGNERLIRRVFSSISVADKTKLKSRLINIANLSSASKKHTTPIVYIRPSHDWLVDTKAVETVCTVFTSAEVVTLQGGHFIAQSDPSGCTNVIQRMYEQTMDATADTQNNRL